MYAIVRTGGKQYRVEQGQSLLVERLAVDDGASLDLEPLLVVDGTDVVDEASALGRVRVQARVVGHERGPKLRVVKFKPKRGYRRRTGHRQELTRLEVTAIKVDSSRRGKAAADKEPAGAESPKPVAADVPASRSRSRAESKSEDAPPSRSRAEPREDAPPSRSRAEPREDAPPSRSRAKPKEDAPPSRSRAKPKEDEDGS